MENQIIEGDCLEVMKGIEDNSVDLIVTDPPYGYSFMNKDWDKAVIPIPYWKECLRILRDGAFCFVMSAPRQDVLNKAISNLGNAGFNISFTPIYYTFASGFPKASNIGKMVDKRGGQYMGWFANYLKDELKKRNMLQKDLAKHFPSRTNGLTGCVHNWIEGKNIPTPQQFNKICKVMNLPFENIEEAKREITGKDKTRSNIDNIPFINRGEFNRKDKPATPQAKALDGSYAGFQPKPAVEVILVAMKPLSEKTYVDQALKNGKGITWLDDCRVPYEMDGETRAKFANTKQYTSGIDFKGNKKNSQNGNELFKLESGRFPANLIVSDNNIDNHCNYSRYFSLDKWFAKQLKKLPIGVQKTFPFLIVPKASKGEKNRGLEFNGLILDESPRNKLNSNNPNIKGRKANPIRNISPKSKGNHHPTVKPLKLMSYLITLGSREGDLVLDPFVGSGTTCIACKQLNRRFIGIDNNSEYVEIAKARLEAVQPNLFASIGG